MSEFPPKAEPAKRPLEEMSEEEQYKLVLIDQSRDARDQARDLADKQLTEELNEGGWLKRTVNGIWKGNLLKDYYRQKYTRQHEAAIAEDNNVLQAESLPEAQTRSINALVTRFQHGEDELIHTEAGEKRETHTDDELSTGIKALIRSYAVEGTLNETTLEQAKKKLLAEYGKEHPEADLSKSLVLTDNLLEIAQSIKGRFTHDEAMEAAIANMEIITGEARNGVRTEAQYSKVDKLVDKISKTKIGSLVTPATLATGAALAMSVAGVATKSVVGAAAATAGLGTVAGVWAGVRENKRVKDERSQHAREMATGGDFDRADENHKGDKRRNEMEATRYESVSALDAAKELLEKTSEEALAAGEGQSEAVRAALEALARAQARVELSDTENIDLIHYSSKADVGEERMKFDLARIESRRAIAKALSPELRAELGLLEDTDIKDIVAGHVDAYKAELHEDMSDKDKAFRALKRRRVATAAVTGTVVGLAGGLIAQETMAAIDPSRFGIFEALSGANASVGADGEVHQTILTSAFTGEGEHHIDTFEASSNYDQHDFSESSFIKTGDDMEWNQNEDGTYTIVGPDGKVAVEDITVGADGSMDQPTIERIEAAGLNIEDNSWPEQIESTTTREIGLDQYWQENASAMQSTSIDTWYMNNSPNPDLNELKLFRGGENGLIDGGFRFESGMTVNGSFVGGESVNPVDAMQQGNLVWVVSKMGEDSGEMFTIPAGPDGSLTVMQDDPAGAFFTEVNGRAELAEGYRLHAFYSDGVDANGVLHGGSLATMVGEAQVATTTQSETVVTEVMHHEYTITSNGYETTAGSVTEVAPITPIVGRKPLEVLKAYREGTPVGIIGSTAEMTPETAVEKPYYYYGGGEIPNHLVDKWRKERSPRLKRNPDADLDTGQELSWYKEAQRKLHDDGYIGEVDDYIEASDILKNITDETKAFVCIPVAAASESENIYRTLSMFGRQDSADAIKESMIILNVNWKEELTNDPEQLERIRKTLSEIERARADFPDLKIASFNKVWTKEFVKEKEGKIYGEIIKVLYDTAAFAVDRAIKTGNRSGDTEALIITNDADTEGMSRSYLKNYLKTFKENTKQDAFTALIRRGTEAYKDYPGYGVVSAFYGLMTQTMLRHQARGGGGFSTDGPNSGIRMSMYAAMGGVEESVGAGADGMLTHRMNEVRRAEGERTFIQRLRGQEAPKGSERALGKFIPGAAIDTVPDRLLGAYKKGKWIATGWDTFDTNAYEEREESLVDAVLDPENPEEDINDIATRIEASLDGFGSYWWNGSPGAMKSAMAWTFGLNRDDIPEEKRTAEDKNLYEYTWDHSKDGEGRFTFKFTDDGKEWLKNRLMRGAKGRFDPYGTRLRRQLYNEVAKNRERQPLQATPRMLT